MPNLVLTRKTNLSSFRKIAIGTWTDAKDPSVYGCLEIRVDETLAYIEAFRAHTGKRLTITHLLAKAVGLALAEMPDANAILRYNNIYMRETVDIFFQVAMEDPVTRQIDLSGLTVRNADKRSIADIVDDFEAAAAKVRAGKDEEKEATRSSFKSMPNFLLGPVLDLISFLIYTLNLDLRWAGLPKDPFGSAMVTNVGSLGLEEAYVPLVPYSKVPLLIAVGAVKKVPIVTDDDRIEVARVMKLFATFDHRILDGVHASKMSKSLRKVFADPWTHFDPVPRPASPATSEK